MAEPRLSIIIPTLNRGKLFHDTVSHCLEQREKSWEMWLVDQSDEEQEAANRAMVDELSDSRIHYLHLTERGVPNARNEGLARCNGEIVLFLDDDVILLADDFFDAHLDSYVDGEVGGVTGRIVERTVRPNTKHTANHISWGGRIITNLYGTEPCQIRSLKGANMSYRAKAIEKLGGFDRQYIGTALLEDTDFSTRVHLAGWRLLFVPRAELVHLSAINGGVRVEDEVRTHCWRFRSTAYFVAKNRGWNHVPQVACTFSTVAAKLAWQWRQPSAVGKLMQAFNDGLEAFRKGPDQGIPVLDGP